MQLLLDFVMLQITMLMDVSWGIVFHHEKIMYSVSAKQLLVPFGAELLQIHHLWRVDTSLVSST
jgi:hypothetical protein